MGLSVRRSRVSQLERGAGTRLLSTEYVIAFRGARSSERQWLSERLFTEWDGRQTRGDGHNSSQLILPAVPLEGREPKLFHPRSAHALKRISAPLDCAIFLRQCLRIRGRQAELQDRGRRGPSRYVTGPGTGTWHHAIRASFKRYAWTPFIPRRTQRPTASGQTTLERLT